MKKLKNININYKAVAIAGGFLALGALLGWTVHGLTGYAQNTETLSNFEDWRVQCPVAAATELHCQMVQETVNTQTRAPIARVAIGRDRDNEVIQFHLPLGVALPPGINFNLGKEPVKILPYRVCINTCVVEVPLDAAMRASLDAGLDGQFTFTFAEPGAKPVAVPMSLKGFKQAEAAYRRHEAARASWFWRML